MGSDGRGVGWCIQWGWERLRRMRPRRNPHLAYLLFFWAYFSQGTGLSYIASLNVLYLQSEFDLSLTLISVLGLVGSVPWVFKFFIGLLSDRVYLPPFSVATPWGRPVTVHFGRRKLWIVCGGLLYFFGVLVVAFLKPDTWHGYALLAVVLFLAMTGMSMFDTTADALGIDYASVLHSHRAVKRREATIQAIMRVGRALGLVLVVAILASMAQFLGWKVVFFILASTTIPMVILVPCVWEPVLVVQAKGRQSRLVIGEGLWGDSEFSASSPEETESVSPDMPGKVVELTRMQERDGYIESWKASSSQPTILTSAGVLLSDTSSNEGETDEEAARLVLEAGSGESAQFRWVYFCLFRDEQVTFVCMINFIMAIPMTGGIQIMNPFLVDAFDLSFLEVGFYSSVWGVGLIVGAALAYVNMLSIGRRGALLVAVVVASIGTLGMASVWTRAMAWPFVFIFGVAHGISETTSLSVSMHAADSRIAGTMFSVIMASANIGGALGFLLTGVLADWVGFRWALVYLGSCVWLALLPALMIKFDDQDPARGAAEEGGAELAAVGASTAEHQPIRPAREYKDFPLWHYGCCCCLCSSRCDINRLVA